MKALKRAMALLLSLFLLLSAMWTAFAEEGYSYEEVDTYVLHHNVTDDDYDGPNLQYFSPYVTNYTFDGAPSYIQNNIYSLYNTTNKEVVPVYCTDIKVGAFPDHRYRRLNLEDSTYAANAAGRLRAIMRNGFYLMTQSGESMEDHAVRVAAKLRELGTASGVPDLTIGEAISGTQTAIWQAAHGSRLEFTDFVRTIYTTELSNAVKYYDLCNEERENGHVDYTVEDGGAVTVDPESDAYINARIKAVYDYLLSLEPVEATARAVSSASFLKAQEAEPVLNEDGTYDLTLSVTVDVDMTANDSLTLSAVLDNTHFASALLSDGKQEVTLTIQNVPADMAFNKVTLAIDGKQTVSEVFLYDAYGDRETAQTMIGIDDSQLPVHAEMVATTDRILNFYKTAYVNAGDSNSVRHPLEGITFDIYLVAELREYLAGNVKLPEPEDYAYGDMPDLTVLTDRAGWATVNFTQHGMPDGVYLVIEREHPAIQRPVDPFYVIMPATNAEGTGYDYEITVQPKNDLKGNVRIEKDVISLGNDEASVDAYAPHRWIIGTNVPEDIAIGKSFEITDTLDPRLDFLGNVSVNLETADGETVLATLIADTDYTVTVMDEDSLSEGTPSDFFRMELTSAGMGKLANSIGDKNFDDYMLRVSFDAQINANAEVGEEIPNQASLRYLNSVNFDFYVESDQPVVMTGGANLLKVDSQNKSTVLPGATFELYRKATEAEVAAGGEELKTIAGVGGYVVKVSFFDNTEMLGEKTTVVTTDEKGKAAIYGLAYGEYYLLETEAPDGYNLPGDAAAVTINAASHMEEMTFIVENVAGTILPSTGGSGTTVFTLSGLLLIAVSGLLLWSNQRKKKESD